MDIGVRGFYGSFLLESDREELPLDVEKPAFYCNFSHFLAAQVAGPRYLFAKPYPRLNHAFEPRFDECLGQFPSELTN